MFREEFRYIKESKEDLRKFGLIVGGVLLLIAALLFYFEKPSAIYLTIFGGFLFLSGLVIPQILKPLNKIWMGLAIILGFFMSRIIITVLFYIALTPISIIAKLVGKKFMILNFDKSPKTYWEKRTIIQKKQIDYERQF
jgi:uncharacterized membrane protein